MVSSSSVAHRFGAAALMIVSALAANAEQVPIHDLKTSIAIHAGTRESLRWEIRDVQDAIALGHNPLSVSAGEDLAFDSFGPFGMTAELDGHQFQRLVNGSIQHRGGFELAYPGGSVSLVGFRINPGLGLKSFEVRTFQGELIFLADYAHSAVDRVLGRVQVFNMDLHIAPPFAEKLGQPALAGLVVGVMAIDASSAPAPAPEQEAVAGVPGCGDWTGDKDVAMIAMASVSQTERSGGRVSITPSAALKNVGTGNVPWHAKFSGNNPPYNNDQHPFLVWQMYRMRDGVLEQMAFSDVKHAFLTVNTNCVPGACTSGNTLGIGCEDIYGVGTNVSYNSLSFRNEIKAGKGLWTSTGSHFDQDSDGDQDHPGPSTPNDSFPTHRLVVNEADLDLPGEQYYFETWYIIRDDVDIYNTMAWREINPSFSGNSWTFSFVTSFAQGSALNAWVDETSPGPNASNQAAKVADGNVRVAAKVFDLGNGFFRYEYALMNHDFDPLLGTFRVPLAAGASTSELRFKDLDTDAGNDWVPAVDASGITWTKPAPAPGLDYGRMYNFGFTSSAALANGQATVTAVGATSTPTLNLSVRAPLGASVGIFTDNFESGGTGSWSSQAP